MGLTALSGPQTQKLLTSLLPCLAISKFRRNTTALSIRRDSTLFFANYTSPGDIDRVGLPGGGTPTALATGEMYPLGLTLDANNLYWTSNMSGGYVATVPLAGGAVTQLAKTLNGPTGIAVDANAHYITAAVGGRVWRLSPP